MFDHYDVLDENNWLLYSARNYKNSACTGTNEFLEDLKRIKYIKKLITRFETTGELKERLLLNHVIVLGNVFEPTALCRILFLKMEPQFGFVSPFLMMISMLIEKIINVKKTRVIETKNIAMNQDIVNALRELLPKSIRND